MSRRRAVKPARTARSRQPAYFRNRHTDLEPLGAVAHQDGIPVHVLREAVTSGEVEATQHEGGGWFFTTAQRRAMLKVARERNWPRIE